MLSILLPRGIRNRNPGNIRLSKTVWHGQKPAAENDAQFAEFDSDLYGLRALMVLLLTYYLKYGLDTVSSIINRFAPPHENATDRYIHSVAKAMNVRRMDTVNLRSKPVLITLAKAIVLHENGKPPEGRPDGWYEQSLYERAADLALTKGT